MSKAMEIRNNAGLTKAMMINVVPSVFGEQKHENTSDKYAFISSRNVLNTLWKEGFAPVFAAQRAFRDESKRETTKHIIRLRRRDELGLPAPESNEVVIVNSHDTGSSFQLFNGRFRLVCGNEMILGDMDDEFRVRHVGDIMSSVVENVGAIARKAVETSQFIDRMKTIELTPNERGVFAQSAMTLKFDNNVEMPFNPEKLLSLRRWEDNKKDLYTTFNVVQENLVKGGIQHRNKAGNRTTTRPIKSIDKDIKLNKALWQLTKAMMELKG